MEKKYWFTAKKYGWGWVPASREGWLVTLAYLFALLWLANKSKYLYGAEDIFRGFLLPVIGLSLLLVLICYKTGEKPHWRWGGK